VQQGASSPARAYVELAEATVVARAVFEAAGPELLGPITTLGHLRRLLSAEASTDAPLLRLRVSDTDAARAAALANLWADEFFAVAGQLYGQDQANLALYEQAEAQALADLNAAEAALAAFQSGNVVNILQAQLDSQQASLTDYLNRAREAKLLSQDLQELLARLNDLAADSPAAMADDIALLSITSRLYGGLQTDPSGLMPDNAIQVVLSGDQTLTSSTVADQRRLAEDLLASLETRRQALAQQAADLEPQILALQGQVAEAQVRADELTRARDLAVEVYSTLAIRVQEAGIAVQQSANVAQIVGAAQAPTRATGPARLTYVGLSAALGGVLGVGLALLREFLRPAAEADGQTTAAAQASQS